jgi:hypothetical protein
MEVIIALLVFCLILVINQNRKLIKELGVLDSRLRAADTKILKLETESKVSPLDLNKFLFL